ncbi:hypothetical protein ACFLVH_00345 [Chloroflexota bacterium]
MMGNPHAQLEILPRSDKRSSEVFDYIEWCCRDQGLDTRFSREVDKVVVPLLKSLSRSIIASGASG